MPTDDAIDLDALVAALTARFPDLPRERVETEVADVAHRYPDAKVTDYLPVLIEREVGRRLRQGGAGGPDA